ncbi:MAG: galactokinase family protein, partial [Bacteroidota bacterium]|nr:galactokinase family protein [Bacteroidota bacterium]
MAKINSLTAKIADGKNSLFQELYGFDDSVLKEQASRYSGLMAEFQKSYGTDDVELFSSPGRTEIGGNHTDHNYGRVLAGAVNLDMIAVAAKNATNTIRIKSVGYPEFQVDLSTLAIDESQFYTSSALVKGICARMKQLNYEIGGFDACIEGRVPKGSGLSSSASFEVLIGAITNHLFNDGKMSAVENGIIGQWSENNYFGKPCGLMDQTACSVGGL